MTYTRDTQRMCKGSLFKGITYLAYDKCNDPLDILGVSLVYVNISKDVQIMSRCQRCAHTPVINLHMYSHLRINSVYLLSDWVRPWISYLHFFEYDYRHPIDILTSKLLLWDNSRVSYYVEGLNVYIGYIYVLFTVYEFVYIYIIPSPTFIYKACVNRGVGVADPALARHHMDHPPLLLWALPPA